MVEDMMGWLGEAARGKLCEVSVCTANPVTEINGRALCAKHRDMHDAISGPACGRCGNTRWIALHGRARPTRSLYCV